MKAVRHFFIFLLLCAACIQSVQTQVVRRRPVSAGTWTPSSLGSTLKVWLESDSGTGTTIDGATIGTWNDKTSNANNCSSAGATAITNQTNEINGLQVVRFDGDSAYCTLPNNFSSLTEIQAFIVVRLVVDPPTDDVKTGFWDFSTAVSNAHVPYSDGTIYDSFGSTSRFGTVNPTPALTSWRMYSVTSKSGEWTSYLDGTQLYTTASNTVGITTSPKLGRSLTTYYLNGDIAFLAICSPVITGTNLSNMKTYIANKYGLTIS